MEDKDIGNRRIVVEVPADMKTGIIQRVYSLKKEGKVTTIKDYFMQLIKRDLNGSGIL
jgi:hypothetical protein